MKLFTMYIGLEKDRAGFPIKKNVRDFAVHMLKDKLITDFGGYSVTEAMGGFRHENGLIAEEKCLRVEVVARDDQMEEIKQNATMFCNLFRQESILVNCSTVESDFI